MQAAQAALASIPERFLSSCVEPEITAVILSHNRLERTLALLDSIRDHVRIPLRTLVIDNHSADPVAQVLSERAAQDRSFTLVLLDENLGCAGGRMFAVPRVDTEYVLLLDNDVVVLPGAVELLYRALRACPGATGATGKVVFPDGRIHLCGAEFRPHGEILGFELLGAGRSYHQDIGGSSTCDWIPGCLALLQRKALEEHPYDANFKDYYEDLEWCYRIAHSGAGPFLRCVDAMAIHYHEPKALRAPTDNPEARHTALRYTRPIARFRRLYGKILPTVFDFVPELGHPDEQSNIESARLFLIMLDQFGADWMLEAWNRGTLSPVFAGASAAAKIAESHAAVTALREEAGAGQERAKRLVAELASRDARIAELVDRVAERQSAVDSLAAQTAAQQQRIEKLVARVAERQQAVDMVSAELQARNQKIAELVEQVEERQAVVSGFSLEISRQQQRIEQLVAQVAERHSEALRLSDELTSRDAKIAALVQLVHERQTAVDSLGAEVASQQKRIEELVEQVAERQREVDRLLSAPESGAPL
jgi:GT2 family glycosyltransferase/uncharacterized coiled-coil protein SlyX